MLRTFVYAVKLIFLALKADALIVDRVLHFVMTFKPLMHTIWTYLRAQTAVYASV